MARKPWASWHEEPLTPRASSGRCVADGSPVCELLPPVRLTGDSQNNMFHTSPITEATSSLCLLSQNARGWWLRNYTKEMCCSQFQSPKSPRSRCQQIWCLGRVCFWVHRGLCSACVLTWQSPGPIWVLFNKGPEPMKEVPALMTQVTSPRPHLQIASHRVGFQPVNSEGHTHSVRSRRPHRQSTLMEEGHLRKVLRPHTFLMNCTPSQHTFLPPL